MCRCVVCAVAKFFHKNCFLKKMSSTKKIWYNYWNPPYSGDEPNFFDTAKYQWAREIETNWTIYEKEILDLIAVHQNKFQPYFASGRYTGSQGWKTISLITWGIKVPHNLNDCPQLKKLIESNPNWLSASVNLLEPQTVISEHSGDTNAIFRCHVGIEIPALLPECGFRVHNENRSWEKGKVLIFLDAFPHSAWNNTSSKRIIFLFDILRPEFSEQKNKVCIRVRSFLLLQLLAEKIVFLKNISKQFQKIIFYALCVFLWILLPYQKKAGVIRKH